MHFADRFSSENCIVDYFRAISRTSGDMSLAKPKKLHTVVVGRGTDTTCHEYYNNISSAVCAQVMIIIKITVTRRLRYMIGT